MMLTPRSLLLPSMFTVLAALTAGAGAAYGDDEDIIERTPRNDARTCAQVVAVDEAGDRAFAPRPDFGAMTAFAEQTERATGGTMGRVMMQGQGELFVVRRPEGDVLVYDQQGQRIAVGARMAEGAPLTWFDAFGLNTLRCE